MLSPISVPAAEAWPPDLIISTASLPPHKKQPRVAAPPKDQGFTFPCGLSLAYGAQHELAWQLKIRHTTTTLGRPPIWGVPKPNVPAPPAIIHLPKPVITKHNKRSRTCWFLPLPRVHASCTPSHLLGLGSRIPMHALASGRTAPVRPRRTSPSNAPVPISTRDSTAPRDLLTALLAPPLHPPPLRPFVPLPRTPSGVLISPLMHAIASGHLRRSGRAAPTPQTPFASLVRATALRGAICWPRTWVETRYRSWNTLALDTICCASHPRCPISNCTHLSKALGRDW